MTPPLDWKVWLTLGGLVVLLLGNMVDALVCHGLHGNARAVCGILADTAEQLGRDAESVPDATDAGP